MKKRTTNTRTLIEIINEKDIKELLTVEPKKPVIDALTIMAKHKIGALIVMNGSKMVGVISERDIVRKVVAESINSKSTQLEVIMSKNFKWVEPNASIESAVQKMLNNNIRRLVVLEDENLAGVITQTDLTEFLRSKILINATVENRE